MQGNFQADRGGENGLEFEAIPAFEIQVFGEGGDGQRQAPLQRHTPL